MSRFLRVLGTTCVIVLMAVGGLSCGDDDENPTNPGGTPADVTIQIVGNSGANSYSPNPDTVNVGQTVSWHNADVMTHTATANAIGQFNTGNIGAGGTSPPIAMTIPGSYAYHCGLHPTMTGTLVVEAP